MLPIFWRASAREDLLSIVRYIGDRIEVVSVLHSRQEYP